MKNLKNDFTEEGNEHQIVNLQYSFGNINCNNDHQENFNIANEKNEDIIVEKYFISPEICTLSKRSNITMIEIENGNIENILVPPIQVNKYSSISLREQTLLSANLVKKEKMEVENVREVTTISNYRKIFDMSDNLNSLQQQINIFEKSIKESYISKKLEDSAASKLKSIINTQEYDPQTMQNTTDIKEESTIVTINTTENNCSQLYLNKLNAKLVANKSSVKIENTNLSVVKKDNSICSNLFLCKICLETSTNDKGEYISPCLCTGTCEYIHEMCLKTWIHDKFLENNPNLECEICKYKYDMKFYVKQKLCRVKLCNLFKSITCFAILSGIITIILIAIIHQIIISAALISNGDSTNIVVILVTVGVFINFFLIFFYLRNCKKNIYKFYLYDWKIFNAKDKIIEGKTGGRVPKKLNPKIFQNKLNLPDNKFIKNFQLIEHENKFNDEIGFDIVVNSLKIVIFSNNPNNATQNEMVILA